MLRYNFASVPAEHTLCNLIIAFSLEKVNRQACAESRATRKKKSQSPRGLCDRKLCGCSDPAFGGGVFVKGVLDLKIGGNNDQDSGEKEGDVGEVDAALCEVHSEEEDVGGAGIEAAEKGDAGDRFAVRVVGVAPCRDAVVDLLREVGVDLFGEGIDDIQKDEKDLEDGVVFEPQRVRE